MTTVRSPFTIPLEAEKYYHIFNRGNNSQPIFYSFENYRYFLVKLDNYFDDFLTIHAFILLQNHFHLLVEIKTEQEIKKKIAAFESHEKLRKFLDKPVESILSKQFQYFFISYAKSINKDTGKHGSLFEKPFRRKLITTDEHYRNVMYYIHRNILHHNLPFDYRDYTWSSYSRILEQKPSKLPKERIFKTFDNAENYVSFHEQERDLSGCADELIDY